MKKIMSMVVSAFALIQSAIFALEFNRVQNLCRSSTSRAENVHDAINAIRNYHDGPDAVGRALAQVRQTDAFQSDGREPVVQQNDGGYRYRKGGGWSFEERHKPMIAQVYSVDFDYYDFQFQPDVEIRCDVYDCGAIDIHNCLTLNAYY